MKFVNVLTAAVVSLLLGVENVSAVNILVNPGFESGDFFGWAIGGNSLLTGVDADGTVILSPPVDPPFPPNYSNVRSGGYSAWAVVQDGGDPVERIILSQTLDVAPGQNYDVSFWLGNDSQSTFGLTMDDLYTQIFVDGVGILPSSFMNVVSGSGPDAFYQFAGQFNSGANTSVDIAFAINGSGTSRVGVSFDDFVVDGPSNSVPDPASTLFLLGLAMAGMQGLRWKLHWNHSDIHVTP